MKTSMDAEKLEIILEEYDLNPTSKDVDYILEELGTCVDPIDVNLVLEEVFGEGPYNNYYNDVSEYIWDEYCEDISENGYF